MNNEQFNQLRFVLIGTTHPGNIGATARAMKTMCQKNLYLVNPKIFPCAEATARATGADDILANATVCSSLKEAIQDCQIVIGTSARNRSIPWPVITPRRCAEEITKQLAENRVAVLFGCENSGLTNEELALCNKVIQIPANKEYSSLNLAAAVQIICYEFLTTKSIDKDNKGNAPGKVPLATQDQMEKFYQHLEACMIDIGYFDPEKPRLLIRRMRRLFNRSQLDINELNIMRGLLSAAQSARKSS